MRKMTANLLVVAGAALALGACANQGSESPSAQTGSMAPVRGTGGVVVQAPSRPDTGSMAEPNFGNSGVVVPAPTVPDTGSMAEPNFTRGRTRTAP